MGTAIDDPMQPMYIFQLCLVILQEQILDEHPTIEDAILLEVF